VDASGPGAGENPVVGVVRLAGTLLSRAGGAGGALFVLQASEEDAQRFLDNHPLRQAGAYAGTQTIARFHWTLGDQANPAPELITRPSPPRPARSAPAPAAAQAEAAAAPISSAAAQRAARRVPRRYKAPEPPARRLGAREVAAGARGRGSANAAPTWRAPQSPRRMFLPRVRRSVLPAQDKVSMPVAPAVEEPEHADEDAGVTASCMVVSCYGGAGDAAESMLSRLEAQLGSKVVAAGKLQEQGKEGAQDGAFALLRGVSLAEAEAAAGEGFREVCVEALRLDADERGRRVEPKAFVMGQVDFKPQQ
jgi:hypothetical protein